MMSTVTSRVDLVAAALAAWRVTMMTSGGVEPTEEQAVSVILDAVLPTIQTDLRDQIVAGLIASRDRMTPKTPFMDLRMLIKVVYDRCITIAEEASVEYP